MFSPSWEIKKLKAEVMEAENWIVTETDVIKIS